MKLMPLQNMVLLRLIEVPSKSPIIIMRQMHTVGHARVMAVGPEVRDLKVGDKVMFNTAAGMDVHDDILVRESAILAVL